MFLWSCILYGYYLLIFDLLCLFYALFWHVKLKSLLDFDITQVWTVPILSIPNGNNGLNCQVHGTRICDKWETYWKIWCIFFWGCAVGTNYRSEAGRCISTNRWWEPGWMGESQISPNICLISSSLVKDSCIIIWRGLVGSDIVKQQILFSSFKNSENRKQNKNKVIAIISGNREFKMYKQSTPKHHIFFLVFFESQGNGIPSTLKFKLLILVIWILVSRLGLCWLKHLTMRTLKFWWIQDWERTTIEMKCFGWLRLLQPVYATRRWRDHAWVR